MPIKRIFDNLDELIHSSEFQYFESDKLSNQLFITDPDRAERICDANDDGNGDDGSSPFEHIDDWRDFLNSLKVYDSEYNYWDLTCNFQSFDITETTRARIEAEIEAQEIYWFEKTRQDQLIKFQGKK